MAKIIIEENEEMVGKDLSDRAKKKIDNETKKSIAGVEFNFRYSDGQNIGNYKTDSQGCIELSKLKQGKVILWENQ